MDQVISTSTSEVWLVGYAALDLIFDANGAAVISMGFGGVCTNVARTLAASDIRCSYFYPRYLGEMGRALRSELEAYGISTVHLSVSGFPAVFEAHVDSKGDVVRESFIESELIDKTTLASLAPLKCAIGRPRYLVACADLPVPVLKELRQVSGSIGAKFALIATSIEASPAIEAVRGEVDFLSLNISELRRISQCQKLDQAGVVRVARELLALDGTALVTFGAEGAMLIDFPKGESWYQAVPTIVAASTVGAGDVLTASVLAAMVRGVAPISVLHDGAKLVLSFLRRSSEAEFPFVANQNVGLHELPPPKLL